MNHSGFSHLLLSFRKKAILQRYRKRKNIRYIARRKGPLLSTQLVEKGYLSKGVKNAIGNHHLPDPFHLFYMEDSIFLEKEIFGKSLREDIAEFSKEAERILTSLLEIEEKDFLYLQ